jgi:hypothetical protein
MKPMQSEAHLTYSRDFDGKNSVIRSRVTKDQLFKYELFGFLRIWYNKMYKP